jgi:hypothetical protein
MQLEVTLTLQCRSFDCHLQTELFKCSSDGSDLYFHVPVSNLCQNIRYPNGVFHSLYKQWLDSTSIDHDRYQILSNSSFTNHPTVEAVKLA